VDGWMEARMRLEGGRMGGARGMRRVGDGGGEVESERGSGDRGVGSWVFNGD